jgi:integrase
VQRAVLLRDVGCILYLWLSAQRGKECGRLVVSDFTQDGLACLPAWGALEAGHLPESGCVYVEPSLGTKSRQHGRPGEIKVTVEPAARAAYCFLRWVPKYAAVMRACGSLVTGWLFKPLQLPELRVFREGPLESQAMNAAYQRHMKACEFFMGETLHGIRRGRYQHLRYRLGWSVQQIMDVVLVSCPDTVGRYLHRSAHGPRVRRAEARRAGGRGGAAATAER